MTGTSFPARGSICFQSNILLFIHNPEPLSISLFTDTDEDLLKPVDNTMFASILRKCIHQTLNNDYITIGIPFTYIYMNSQAHQNMLIIIIDKIKNKITVEHFDPHGYLSNRIIPTCVIKFIEIAFNARVTDINIIFTNVEELFPIVLPEIMAFEYVSPFGICGNTSIQSLTTRKRKWANSCVLFSLWYGFLRLLNSKEDYKVTYNRMMNMMNASPENPYRAIQNIAKSVFDVLDITDASPNSEKGPRVRGFSNINTNKGSVKFTRRSPERMPYHDASTPSNSPNQEPVPMAERQNAMAKPQSVKNKSTRRNKIISKIKEASNKTLNRKVLSKFRADLKAAMSKSRATRGKRVSKNANSI